MSEARYLIGDVFERMAEIPDGSIDLLVTSPPFLALRSYLPSDHPDKGKEIGSEATPADFLTTLLALTAEWRRVLAPHGSLCVELGDTYSSPGGTTDNREDSLGGNDFVERRRGGGAGWPLDKSLCLLPTLYPASLAYGRNLLTGQPCEPWRIRNQIVWHRPNPPVGGLGDKVRPSTSYITVACIAKDRWFDLDAERTPYDGPPPVGGSAPMQPTDGTPSSRQGVQRGRTAPVSNPAGAPPLDCWIEDQHVELVEIADRKCRNCAGTGRSRDPDWGSLKEDCRACDGTGRDGHRLAQSDVPIHDDTNTDTNSDTTDTDVWTLPTQPYKGSHYATFPITLPRKLINLMCPRQVCTVCGEPRRRIVGEQPHRTAQDDLATHIQHHREVAGFERRDLAHLFPHYKNTESIIAQFSNWERGKNVPSPDDWEILQPLLQLSDTFNPYIYGSRQWTESLVEYVANGQPLAPNERDTTGYRRGGFGSVPGGIAVAASRIAPNEWSDCGHDTWRRGRVLDPFAGSGTTLVAASELGRDSIGIDIDSRNLDLARQRCGMFLVEDDIAEVAL